MAKHAENQGLKPPEDTSIVRDYSIERTGAPTHNTLDVVVLVPVTCRSHRTVITHHGHQITSLHEPREA